jgi:hypothetical protein
MRSTRWPRRSIRLQTTCTALFTRDAVLGIEPHALYARASDLLSVLGRAQVVAMALSDQIEKAARAFQLGSDDDRSANEHAERAACLLVQVAGEVAEAGLAGIRRGTPWVT